MAASKKVKNKRIIKACTDIAMQSVEHGCLFVIETKPRIPGSYYAKVFEELSARRGRPLSILNDNDVQVIKLLASLDGAVIIDNKGNMREFGVTLKRQKTFRGHGKRHAFALGTSKINGLVCILASEEDRHVRMFREGVCVVDMSAKTKLPASTKFKVAEILDTPLSKLLVASGVAASILTLNPIPAIITITGSGVLVSYGFDKLKKFF